MNGKSIFIWSVIGGLALSGGTAGVIGLLVWVVAFWLLEKLYDGCAAFYKGFIAGRAARSSQPKRPTLRLIPGGKH